ncbi:protein of unknown function (plasmid) [Pseudodesulfovibrio profundus]|uniref:Uncharacterized protein n=1 Tax=Pseudodesulfovibrio profundus TaxID=57320 RepID=A0A2C8FEV9_9BACT|nr:protein of unknown function [Pseudodesulfovibrio profundus]
MIKERKSRKAAKRLLKKKAERQKSEKDRPESCLPAAAEIEFKATSYPKLLPKSK